MNFPKVIVALTIASSLWGAGAQEGGISTRSEWVGLKVSESVGWLTTQPRTPFSITSWYRSGWDEIGTTAASDPIEEPIDPIKENLAWINQKHHDPCRDIKKTVTQKVQCQISWWGSTDTIAGRDVRDWKMRKSQIDFANKFTKQILGDTVSLTEGTLTQPSKIVWFQHWKPWWNIDPTAGWRSYFKIEYYRTF